MKKENETVAAYLPETKEVYKAPAIEIAEVRVERGFHTYPGDPGGGDDGPGEPSW